MRFKSEATAGGRTATTTVKSEAEAGSDARDQGLRDEICSDLQARGVDPAAAEPLAASLSQQLDEKGDSYEATLDGIALGFRAQDVVAEQLAKSAGELQEIERLMGSFASELSKLDEVLEVLAAYLRRLRTAAPAPGDRILH